MARRFRVASKYASLTEYLSNVTDRVVEISFDEIERIIPGLPASALRHQAWWANSRTSQNHARAWLDANRRAAPRFSEGYVRFTLTTDEVVQSRTSQPTSITHVRETPQARPVEGVVSTRRENASGRRIGLVGCVKEKSPYTRAARDLYQSTLFVGRRNFVEHSCDEWWILSALHGLVAPDDILEPYDVTLNNASIPERRVWSSLVLKQLAARVQPRPGDQIEFHAGANYRAFGLEEGLRELGCSTESPTEGLRMGEQLSFYSRIRWS